MSRLPIASPSDNQRRQSPPLFSANAAPFVDDEEPSLAQYKDILITHKWLIAGTTILALLIGLAYVIIATPIYRANLLVQIDDSAPQSKSFLTETTGLGELKTTASGEIQVLGSRMILGAAVDQVGLQVNARPRSLPLIGNWLSRSAKDLSTPGFLGLNGYVYGDEQITVKKFDVPSIFEDGEPFKITVVDDGKYSVSHELLDATFQGTVGTPTQYKTSNGLINIDINELSGKAGAEFLVSVSSRLSAIESLQSRLLMAEQGRQSNVVNVTLEDSDPTRLRLVLDSIAEHYVGQNVERKSAEAEKTLSFLNAQLPIFERQLKASEDAFAKFRNQNGTIAFDEEAKVWLQSAAELQSNLLNLQQSKLDLSRTTNENHPKIQTLNQQIAAIQFELGSINRKISGRPNVQRDALRLERDVQANSTQYQSMQNNALQMRLVSEGKIGNVRILDKAVVSNAPVKPQKKLILAFAIVLGLLLGLGMAIVRSRMRKQVKTAAEVCKITGLELFGSISQSPEQSSLTEVSEKKSTQQILSDRYPHSQAVEAIRNLRVALRKTLSQASNNRILITGATAGIGKTFIASNLASLIAQTGKRVLLISADLRKDGKNDVFGLIRSPGLAELAYGEITIDKVIRSEIRPNLDVLTAGKIIGFPADMFEAESFEVVLNKLSELYDHLVIDVAPIASAADAVAIAPLCGCVLLVARSNISEIAEVNEGLRCVMQAGGYVDGLIFNGARGAKAKTQPLTHSLRTFGESAT